MTRDPGAGSAEIPTTPSDPAPFFQRTIRSWRLRTPAGAERVVPVRIEHHRPLDCGVRFHRLRINRTWENFTPRPGELAVAATLSCGHEVTLARPKPPGSERVGAPCPDCGAGPRKAATESAARRMLGEAIQRAAADALRLPALVDCVAMALEARRIPPKSEEAERIADAIDRAARLAGLLDAPDPGGEDSDS